MTDRCYARLDDKAVLQIAGPDARAYLQGQFTQDVRLLDQQAVIYGCVLTPQGKTVADAWVTAAVDGSLLLVHEAAYSDALLARLRMFTLGHDVDLRMSSLAVVACWPADGDAVNLPDDSVRLPLPGVRACWMLMDEAQQSTLNIHHTAADWERYRILAGMPRLGCEWLPGDYPMNASLRERDGISFDKGCYVGQEISSRMHWRHGVRYALYCVEVEDGKAIACPADVVSTAAVGRLGSLARDAAGHDRGIARLPVGSDETTQLSVQGCQLHVLRPCGHKE